MCSIDDKNIDKLMKLKESVKDENHQDAISKKIDILKGNKTVTK